MEVNCLKETMLEQYQFLKQKYDALSQQMIEKDEVIQKIQDYKQEHELEISRIQKYEIETVDVDKWLERVASLLFQILLDQFLW